MPAGNSRRVGGKGASELQTEKMVVIEVGDPYRLGLHDARRDLKTAGGVDGSARNLQGNHGRYGQRTANYH